MSAASEKPLTFRMLYSLLKPGLSFAVILTILPGLLLTRTLPSLTLTIFTMLGTMLVAMSSFCYNQLLETQTDARMERTRDRALPSGSLTITAVSVLGGTLLMVGFAMLYIWVNLTAACIALASFFIYNFVYTYLKSRTEHNTVIGGLSGAIGPLIGEAAVRGNITQDGFVLFLLLFLWQPPHFWALSIYLEKDYAQADLPMLPVARGVPYTIRQMLLYQALLIICLVLVVYPLNLGGMLYAIPSLLLGALVFFLMFRLKSDPSPVFARKIFFLTILHMLVWHISLFIDLYLQAT